MGSCFGLAKQRRTARGAETAVHDVTAVGYATVVPCFTVYCDCFGTETDIHSTATCAKVLAQSTPARTRYYWRGGDAKTDGTTKTTTSNFH